jgi:branched-chain amino acid transport system substrate-binding protein
LGVELLVRDNASVPSVASSQARELAEDNGICALIGGVTPRLGIPASVVAEQMEIPILLTIVPLRAWLEATETAWSWAWDFFFDERQMTQTQFLAANLVETNRRVALFTDLEEDGIMMGGLWAAYADTHSYEIVYHAEFPVGAHDFTSQVAEARAVGADVLIGQLMPAEGRSLLSAVKNGDYHPRLMFLEKCANSDWGHLMQGRAEGILAASWFAEGMGVHREAEFIERYRTSHRGVDSSLATSVVGYTAARVLFDSIESVGTTDREAINAQIGLTDGEYPAGRIRFDPSQACALPAVMTQWRGDDMVLVLRPDGAAGPAPIRILN